MSMVPILPAHLKKEDYWMLSVKGIAWLYVVQEMMKPMENNPDGAKEEAVILVSGADSPMFLLKKKFFPVEVLMRATGMARETLEDLDMIKLTEKDNTDLPPPNVTYWGTA